MSSLTTAKREKEKGKEEHLTKSKSNKASATNSHTLRAKSSRVEQNTKNDDKHINTNYFQMLRNQGQQGGGAQAPLPIEKIGERAFDSMPKVSAEFFAISYGALVRQVLVTSDDNLEAVNHQLEEIGVRIGLRLIEEYVARSGAPPCRTFASTADAIAKVGLKMFLGITAQVANLQVAGGGGTSSGPSNQQTAAATGSSGAGATGGAGASNANESSYSLIFTENPLNFFVELPHTMTSTLWYSSILCGVVRGALEQIGMITEVRYMKDTLRGDTVNEIKVALKNTSSETFKTQ